MKKIILISIAFALSLSYISCGQSNTSSEKTSEDSDIVNIDNTDETNDSDIENFEYSFDITPSEDDNYNPYLDIVNIDETGEVTSVKPLMRVKVDHDSQYEELFSYDFDKNGKLEEIFYSFGSQGYARFLMKPDGNAETINLYNESFDVPTDSEGFWFYMADIFGDSSPEILIYSIIGESSFVKIINYSKLKKSFVKHTYELNSLALSKQLLIKNQKKIFVPIGSQGLFEETPLIIE